MLLPTFHRRAIMLLLGGMSGVLFLWVLLLAPQSDPFASFLLLPSPIREVKVDALGPDAVRSGGRAYTFLTAQAATSIQRFYRWELSRRGWRYCTATNPCANYLPIGDNQQIWDVYQRVSDQYRTGPEIVVRIWQGSSDQETWTTVYEVVPRRE